MSRIRLTSFIVSVSLSRTLERNLNCSSKIGVGEFQARIPHDRERLCIGLPPDGEFDPICSRRSQRARRSALEHRTGKHLGTRGAHIPDESVGAGCRSQSPGGPATTSARRRSGRGRTCLCRECPHLLGCATTLAQDFERDSPGRVVPEVKGYDYAIRRVFTIVKVARRYSARQRATLPETNGGLRLEKMHGFAGPNFR